MQKNKILALACFMVAIGTTGCASRDVAYKVFVGAEAGSQMDTKRARYLFVPAGGDRHLDEMAIREIQKKFVDEGRAITTSRSDLDFDQSTVVIAVSVANSKVGGGKSLIVEAMNRTKLEKRMREGQQAAISSQNYGGLWQVFCAHPKFDEESSTEEAVRTMVSASFPYFRANTRGNLVDVMVRKPKKR